jgi:hypothetical protein
VITVRTEVFMVLYGNQELYKFWRYKYDMRSLISAEGLTQSLSAPQFLR